MTATAVSARPRLAAALRTRLPSSSLVSMSAAASASVPLSVTRTSADVDSTVTAVLMSAGFCPVAVATAAMSTVMPVSGSPTLSATFTTNAVELCSLRRLAAVVYCTLVILGSDAANASAVCDGGALLPAISRVCC